MLSKVTLVWLVSCACSMLASCVVENSRSRATHGFLRDHRADGTHMLHIDLLESSGDRWPAPNPSWLEMIGEECTISSNTVVHQASWSSAPTALLFDRTVGQVGDRIVSARPPPPVLRAATFQQGVEGQMVIVQALQPGFDIVEIPAWSPPRGVVLSTVIESGDVLGHGLLGGDHLIETLRQYRPSAMRYKGMPLLALLLHHDKGIMQVLDLRAHAQQGFRLAHMQAAFQKPMVVPSLLRCSLTCLFSVIASMSRSKISGWNTSSTRLKFFSTAT